jgi:glyoxylase-like metal-dependent hydrolase (beta-lactamase superfamily II)
VLDPGASVLVAGDALLTVGGPVALPGAQFTDDMEAARQSAIKLGSYTFETLLVGHGEPILAMASTQVAALGAAC